MCPLRIAVLRSPSWWIRPGCWLLAMVVAASTAACDLTPPRVPGELRAVAPTSQEGEVGEPVAAVPKVRLFDQDGRLLPGVPVAFTVVEGGGVVTLASVPANGEGEASPGGWTLGTSAGANT